MDWLSASKKFNFIKIGDDGIPEIYADHHMLSSLRTCEAYFQLGLINRIGSVGRSWSLEWGQWIHRRMEDFYKSEQAHSNEGKDRISLNDWVTLGIKDWRDCDLDFFKDTKSSKNIGGLDGSMALLAEYYTVYGSGQERIKVVGMELPFGHHREVLIMDGMSFKRIEISNDVTRIMNGVTSWHPFRSYLTGRMDMIVDDGRFIMPLDTKSTSYFDGTEGTDFKPHDGMQGYAYALNTMLGEEFAKQGKQCNKTIINHIALRPGKSAWDRFKRSYISYTPDEMEEFRLRNAATFSQIYQLLILERPAQWTTGIQCSNMYFHDCPYKSLHGVAPTSREALLYAQYKTLEEWNPYIEKPSNKEPSNVIPVEQISAAKS